MTRTQSPNSPSLFLATRAVVAVLTFIALTLTVGAQEAPASQIKLPTPPPVAARYPGGAYQYLYRGSLSCGVGASTSMIATRPATMCGFGFTGFPFIMAEFGVMGPLAHYSPFSAYMSIDAPIPVTPSIKAYRKLRGDPLLIIGYTRMFEVGHALDYGIGYQHPIDESHSLQFELRDYATFANPVQHNVMLRVVWVTGIPD